jgi:hypothetical protein
MNEGSLYNLYRTNFKKYVEYCLKDSELLVRIDKKTELLFNAISLAYETMVNFSEYSGATKLFQNYIYKITDMINNNEFDMSLLD